MISEIIENKDTEEAGKLLRKMWSGDFKEEATYQQVKDLVKVALDGLRDESATND